MSGPQLKQFADAVLDGFPTRADLELLSLDGLGVTLDAAASGGALPTQVRELILHAQAHGTLDALVRGAVDARPHNDSIRRLAADFARWTAERTIAAEAPPVNPTTLRQAIVGAFSVEELQTLSADVENLLRGRGMDIPVSLEIVGGAGKPAQVLNLIQYLQRRGQLAVLVEAVRATRPGLV